MSFLKDTMYRELPYSTETPSTGFHSFLTVKELQEKILKHQNHLYRCRSIGVVTSEFGRLALHEIDNNAVRVCLSLVHIKHRLPFTALPFVAQVFGFVHYKPGIGPVMFAHTVIVVAPRMAIRLRSTMEWLVDSHFAKLPIDEPQNKEINE